MPTHDILWQQEPQGAMFRDGSRLNTHQSGVALSALDEDNVLLIGEDANLQNAPKQVHMRAVRVSAALGSEKPK